MTDALSEYPKDGNLGPCCWPECDRMRLFAVPVCQLHAQAAATAIQPRRDPQPKPEVNGRRRLVYYLKVGALVKIGYTEQLHQRIRQYPPDAELLAVEPGGPDLEKQRHGELRASLARGREWFHDTEPVRRHIATVLEQHGQPVVIKPRTARRHKPKIFYPVTTRTADNPASSP